MIVLADVVGTLAFTVTAITAAVVFSTAAQWVGAITAMALFAIGVFAFLWSYWNAVQRSRDEQIGVMQMYLLLGAADPAAGAADDAADARGPESSSPSRRPSPARSPTTDRRVRRSPSGILVPMFGLGLNGLWCAFHGVFPPRAGPRGDRRRTAWHRFARRDRPE